MDTPAVSGVSSNGSGAEPWGGPVSAGDHSQCSPSVGSATFLVAAYSAMIVVGLVGNTCLVLAIARQREIHNVTTVLIANLSCSDILMCVVCLPVTVVYTLMDRWVLGEVLCKATTFVQCTSVTVSAFSLVLIALERHQLIVHPTGWTPAAAHSYLAVAVTWAAGSLVSLPFLTFHVLTDAPFRNLSLPLGAHDDHVVCMESWPSDGHRRAYTTSLLLLQYCLPLTLILLCYLRIFLRLRQRRCGAGPGRGGGRKGRAERRVNAMLVCIVVTFALCWLPLNVFNTLFDWNHQALHVCQHDAIFSACHLAAMASTCANPIFYGFLNSNFKKELGAALRHCQGSHQRGLGRRHWGPPESYESFPLSTVSTDITRSTTLCRTSTGARAVELDLHN